MDSRAEQKEQENQSEKTEWWQSLHLNNTEKTGWLIFFIFIIIYLQD